MATQNQDRLRTHFAALDPGEHSSGWDALWAEGTFIPWDRGYANPALIDFLASPSNPPTSSEPNPTPGAPKPGTVDGAGVQLPAKRGKALVPGCGKGYDVALLASYGYDAYGLEVSKHAADAANKYLSDPGEGPFEGEYAIKDAKTGKGIMKCLLGDFFDDAWLKETSGKGFDLIYDNTVSEWQSSWLRERANSSSSFARSRLRCVQNGLNGWSSSFRRTASLSVSNFPHTSPQSRPGRRGRSHRLYTRSY